MVTARTSRTWSRGPPSWQRAGPTRPTSSTTRTSFPTTATGSREIWDQTEGRVTAFCHGMGTASVMGVSDALKPHGVFIQAHEPASSAAISGGERGSFLIQGWTGLVVPHWNAAKVDHLEPIEDDEAVEMTRRLAEEEDLRGHFDGRRRAHRLAERLGQDAVIVTLAVDSGFKYMSVSPFAGPGLTPRSARRPGVGSVELHEQL